MESCNTNTKSGWFIFVVVQNTATLQEGVERSQKYSEIPVLAKDQISVALRLIRVTGFMPRILMFQAQVYLSNPGYCHVTGGCANLCARRPVFFYTMNGGECKY